MTAELDSRSLVDLDANLTCLEPSDALCAQALAPFTEEVLLETEGLQPGEYTVDVNGELSTVFTIQ